MASNKTILNEDVDKKQDHIYFETAGMAAGFDNPHVVESELMPGEKVVRTFFVNTKMKNKRPPIQVLCYSICTLGLYYLWLLFCGCCRPKTMGNDRRKIVVTSQGRVLSWKHVSAGMRKPNVCFCIKGATIMESYTDFMWFHLHDINTVQNLFARDRPPCCCCTPRFGTLHHNYFRIAVGDRYPHRYDLGSDFNFALPMLETERNVDWAPAASFAGGSGKRGIDASGGSEAIGQLLLEVYSGTAADDTVPPTGIALLIEAMTCGVVKLRPMWIDTAHEAEEASFSDAGEFIKFLVDNRVCPAWCPEGVPPQQQNFTVHPEHTAGKTLIKGTNVQVYPRLFGLMNGEYVVDAIPIFKKLTIRDYCGPIVAASPAGAILGLIGAVKASIAGQNPEAAFEEASCSNTQFFCCDRQWKSDNAVILTNKRMMTASRIDFTTFGEVGWEITSHFIGNTGAGFIAEGAKVKGKGAAFLGSIRTGYGGLTVNTHIVGSKSLSCLALGDAKMKKRAIDFWMTLSHGSVTTIVPGAAIQGFAQAVPNPQDLQAVTKRIPMQQGETVLSGLKSLNQYALDDYMHLLPCACNHYMCLKQLVLCTTCGLQPFQNDQYVAITDRRVWGMSQASNKGLCFMLCKKKPAVVSWMPLDDLKSVKVSASYVMPEEVGFIKRLFVPILPCLNKAYADFELRLGWRHAWYGHPFVVHRYMPHATEGIVEKDDIMHFRKVVGAVTSARTAADAYEVIADQPGAAKA